MRTLSLVENKLVSVPELFVDTLYDLYLDKNQLTIIPKQILFKIEKIHKSNNPISLETKLDLIDVELYRLREYVQDPSKRLKFYWGYFIEYVFDHLVCYRCQRSVESVRLVIEKREILGEAARKINWSLWKLVRCNQDHHTLVDFLKVYETMISLRKRNKLFSDMKIAYNDSTEIVEEIKVKGI